MKFQIFREYDIRGIIGKSYGWYLRGAASVGVGGTDLAREPAGGDEQIPLPVRGPLSRIPYRNGL